MKSVLGWFADPYIHVILVAFLFLNLSTGGKGGSDADASGKKDGCRVCAGDVIHDQECHHEAPNVSARP